MRMLGQWLLYLLLEAQTDLTLRKTGRIMSASVILVSLQTTVLVLLRHVPLPPHPFTAVR